MSKVHGVPGVMLDLWGGLETIRPRGPWALRAALQAPVFATRKHRALVVGLTQAPHYVFRGGNHL